MPQFQEWRRRSPVAFRGPLKDSLLVTETQRADTAAVVYRQKKIDCVELGWSCIRPLAPRRLASLRVIACDHASSPAIGLGVGNRGMKNRTLGSFAMKLWPGDKWQIRLNCESILRGQPSFVVCESSMLPRTVLIVVQRTHEAVTVSEKHVQSPFHNEVGVFFRRTRFGSRISSR